MEGRGCLRGYPTHTIDFSALKYCVIESTAAKIVDWCEDESLASSMKSGSVQMLTSLSTNGNLIRECPELYTID